MGPERLLKAYEAEICRRDFGRLVPLISDAAVFWFNDGSHQGISAIRAAFEKTWSAIDDETYWLTDLNWIARGDGAAACTYTFNWTGTVDGLAQCGSGRGTTVFARGAEGWKIVHEHLSGRPD